MRENYKINTQIIIFSRRAFSPSPLRLSPIHTRSECKSFFLLFRKVFTYEERTNINKASEREKKIFLKSNEAGGGEVEIFLFLRPKRIDEKGEGKPKKFSH